MKSRSWLVLFAVVCGWYGLWAGGDGDAFDAVPFGIPAEGGAGVVWEDPREIHSVEVEFSEVVAKGASVRLEYWGSRWPQQHLAKDREPGGGDVGWMELGNWHNGGWRVADADQVWSTNSVRFAFRPVNAGEFPELKDYASRGRYTLKLRVAGGVGLPKVRRIRAWTDSKLAERVVRVAWEKSPRAGVRVEAFNGEVLGMPVTRQRASEFRVRTVVNPDPNTFDRTLVTIGNGGIEFTVRVDHLSEGPLYLPEYGAVVLAGDDRRDYAGVAREVLRGGKKTLYDRVAAMPEQTWEAAWKGMPAKKSRICFVLGLDGARQKFRLNGNGEVSIRWNDQFMKSVVAGDTSRLEWEKSPVQFQFGLPEQPVDRRLEEESIPTCETSWERQGIRILQTAFATELSGTKGGAPAADACVVAMLRFEFTNTTDRALPVELPITFRGGETYDHLAVDGDGLIWNGGHVRGQVVVDTAVVVSTNQVRWATTVQPHGIARAVVKVPYVPLLGAGESADLRALDFERERRATGDYWRRVLDRGARLVTPEPVLDQFYRAVPGHLLINAEVDPGTRRRFARVGSFIYGNYGNEACMMVLDLDRRGYHQEAAECLEAWLHYQGTVGLPGDFGSKEGVLYGSAGYESGGYNQHHGWILWTLAEHYRFTRDEVWARRVASGILAGADWIIRETGRTAGRRDLGRGLLPAGSLEDIGDWWTWLSTSCYTWRGLDGAAWVLEQIRHPEARRVRSAAEAYHRNLIEHFHAASVRSPVVRLRDGTAVPQVPSHVQRRGRSFGWICETLEGAIHLIITGAIDPKSVEAQWILKDYEDNLFLSNQYGYTLADFDREWFSRGGMSMQACLLLDVEAYLYRDDVKQALRSLFNGLAVSHFPDVHMNTEHALPEMGDWRGDHYKTSDEANACGWLRLLFVREEGDALLLGQGVPRDWLKPGQTCGLENAATHFGPTTVRYRAEAGRITAEVGGPVRNPPRELRLRFRAPGERPLRKAWVNGRPWKKMDRDWVLLPGAVGSASVVVTY